MWCEENDSVTRLQSEGESRGLLLWIHVQYEINGKVADWMYYSAICSRELTPTAFLWVLDGTHVGSIRVPYGNLSYMCTLRACWQGSGPHVVGHMIPNGNIATSASICLTNDVAVGVTRPHLLTSAGQFETEQHKRNRNNYF